MNQDQCKQEKDAIILSKKFQSLQQNLKTNEKKIFHTSIEKLNRQIFLITYFQSINEIPSNSILQECDSNMQILESKLKQFNENCNQIENNINLILQQKLINFDQSYFLFEDTYNSQDLFKEVENNIKKIAQQIDNTQQLIQNNFQQEDKNELQKSLKIWNEAKLKMQQKVIIHYEQILLHSFSKLNQMLISSQESPKCQIILNLKDKNSEIFPSINDITNMFKAILLNLKGSEILIPILERNNLLNIKTKTNEQNIKKIQVELFQLIKKVNYLQFDSHYNMAMQNIKDAFQLISQDKVNVNSLIGKINSVQELYMKILNEMEVTNKQYFIIFELQKLKDQMLQFINEELNVIQTDMKKMVQLIQSQLISNLQSIEQNLNSLIQPQNIYQIRQLENKLSLLKNELHHQNLQMEDYQALTKYLQITNYQNQLKNIQQLFQIVQNKILQIETQIEALSKYIYDRKMIAEKALLFEQQLIDAEINEVIVNQDNQLTSIQLQDEINYTTKLNDQIIQLYQEEINSNELFTKQIDALNIDIQSNCERINLIQDEREQFKRQLTPQQEEANEALESIQQYQITNLKQITNPNTSILKSLCILMYILKKQQSWFSIKLEISKPNFISSLKAFNIQSLKDSEVEQVYSLLQDADVSLNRLQEINQCCYKLQFWLVNSLQIKELYKVYDLPKELFLKEIEQKNKKEIEQRADLIQKQDQTKFQIHLLEQHQKELTVTLSTYNNILKLINK